MNRYILKLFVVGQTARSKRAIANIQRLCHEQLPQQHELVIVDVLEQPELAESEKILATPTLIREYPRPERRIIGDLSDRELLNQALDLQS